MPNWKTGPGYTDDDGEQLEQLVADRPLTHILGNKHAAKLQGKARDLTWGDLLRLNSWFQPPQGWKKGGEIPEPSDTVKGLTVTDIMSIAEAFESKTGRHYAEGYLMSCCTCMLTRPRP